MFWHCWTYIYLPNFLALLSINLLPSWHETLELSRNIKDQDVHLNCKQIRKYHIFSSVECLDVHKAGTFNSHYANKKMNLLPPWHETLELSRNIKDQDVHLNCKHIRKYHIFSSVEYLCS